MRRKYSIGFLMGAFLLSVLYCISDAYFLEKTQEEPRAREVTFSGDERVYEYYLLEENGVINVYLGDRQTLFEKTSIRLSQLPEEIREEVQRGKPVEDKKALYSFLENYSS